MRVDAVGSRWFRAAVVGSLVAVLAGALALPVAAAETAKERRQRLQQEKKQRDRDKLEQRREAAKRRTAEKAQREQAAATEKARQEQAAAAEKARQEQAAAAEKARRAQRAAKVIKLDEHGFQFSTVDDWMEADGSGVPGIVSVVLYADPKADPRQPPRSSIFVRVLPIEQGKSLDDVVAARTKELNCCGPHYKVEPGADLEIDGEAARTLVFEPQEASVKEKKSFIAAARHGERAYVFWLMTTPDDYEVIRPQAEKIIRSTKWLDGTPAAGDGEKTDGSADDASEPKAETGPATTAKPAKSKKPAKTAKAKPKTKAKATKS